MCSSPHGTVSVERRPAAGVRAMHSWHACREGARGPRAAPLLPSRHSLRGATSGRRSQSNASHPSLFCLFLKISSGGVETSRPRSRPAVDSASSTAGPAPCLQVCSDVIWHIFLRAALLRGGWGLETRHLQGRWPMVWARSPASLVHIHPSVPGATPGVNVF